MRWVLQCHRGRRKQIDVDEPWCCPDCGTNTLLPCSSQQPVAAACGPACQYILRRFRHIHQAFAARRLAQQEQPLRCMQLSLLSGLFLEDDSAGTPGIPCAKLWCHQNMAARCSARGLICLHMIIPGRNRGVDRGGRGVTMGHTCRKQAHHCRR